MDEKALHKQIKNIGYNVVGENGYGDYVLAHNKTKELHVYNHDTGGVDKPISKEALKDVQNYEPLRKKEMSKAAELFEKTAGTAHILPVTKKKLFGLRTEHSLIMGSDQKDFMKAYVGAHMKGYRPALTNDEGGHDVIILNHPKKSNDDLMLEFMMDQQKALENNRISGAQIKLTGK